jgi:lambda family phage portal protein
MAGEGKSVLVDARGAPLRRDPKAMAFMSGSGGWQSASRRDPSLASWNPLTLPADPVGWDRQAINARARDLIRNSGLAEAAVTKQTDMVVGQSFRLISIPDHAALGIAPAEAMALGRAIETLFRSWAHDPYRRCDRLRRHTFPGLINLAYRERCQVGEEFVVIHNKPRPNWPWRTALRVVDADRASNPNEVMDTPQLRDGIEYDAAGEAVAYHFRNAHPMDPTRLAETYTWTRVVKETAWGRPVCIHGFESRRPEQRRGISPFSAIMAPFRMIDKHGEAELANTVANALMVGFIKSDYNPYQVAESLGIENPGAEAVDWFDVRKAAYKDLRLTFGNSILPVLPPGDEIQLNREARETGDFAAFRASFLQEISSTLGIAYPVLAERWDAVNYSSARAALEETWRGVKARRASFVEQTVNPIYVAWLEEAFAYGHLITPPGAPDFYDAPAAYARALWIGPGRGHIDPKKEREASEIGLRANLTTLQRELAQQGEDWEENMIQIARELALATELKLPSAGLQPTPAQAPEHDPDLETEAD